MVLNLRLPAPSRWQAAKCLGKVRRDSNGELDDPFFEDDEDEESTWDPQDALDFCNGTIDGNVCPIREQCLLFALTNNERMGVWGGMSEKDRKAMRKMWPWKGGREPRPEWKWMPPGQAVSMLPENERKRLGKDDD